MSPKMSCRDPVGQFVADLFDDEQLGAIGGQLSEVDLGLPAARSFPKSSHAVMAAWPRLVARYVLPQPGGAEKDDVATAVQEAQRVQVCR
jgi:hypothetical protein